MSIWISKVENGVRERVIRLADDSWELPKLFEVFESWLMTEAHEMVRPILLTGDRTRVSGIAWTNIDSSCRVNYQVRKRGKKTFVVSLAIHFIHGHSKSIAMC